MAEPFLGEIRMLTCSFPPDGWAHCNGQLLAINQNQALFSLLGTMYGGDGRTTFGLPDLRGRIPVHVGGGISQGERGGEETHTLIVTEMPAHSHTAQAASVAGDEPSPTGRVWGVQTAALAYAPTPNVAMAGTAAAVAGGSQPHANMPPFLVINFCIALLGNFPSRN
jgi:microcystin-dependent protein